MEIKIKETSNYKRFILHEKNRKLNLTKIKKLAEAMKDHNLLPVFPIIVNKKNEILDGQHRHEAAKMAKIPISYIVSNGTYDIDKVAESNSFQSHWKAHDYVNYWMRSGKEDYKELQDICKEYGLSVPNVANLHDSPKIMPAIRNGSFIFDDKAEVLKVLVHAKDIGEQHGFEHWKSRSFLRAIAFILDIKGYSPMRMHQKIQANRSKLVKCYESNHYIELLQEIYNTDCKQELRFI